MQFSRVSLVAFLVLVMSFPTVALSKPLRACLKSDTGRVVIKRRCKEAKGQQEITAEILQGLGATQIGPEGPKGDTGPEGPAGSPGADGQLRIYGDGSSGAGEFSGVTVLDGGAYQYSSLNVESGAVLNLYSGTVLRVAGDCSNAGTISVVEFASGAERESIESNTHAEPYSAPLPGISGSVAQSGECGSLAVSGASDGRSLFEGETKNILMPGLSGGGGGGTGSAGTSAGTGGGTVVILCHGDFTNSGIIQAQGESTGSSGGHGGGGGGVLVLASKSSFTNTGTLDVRGGDGSSGGTNSGPGGGGGGGLINILAPSVDNSLGTLILEGGPGGSALPIGSVSAPIRCGGGAGGSSAGKGGTGGSVAFDGLALGGGNGAAGRLNILESDPTALF